jgi:hypothetical protein
LVHTRALFVRGFHARACAHASCAHARVLAVACVLGGLGRGLVATRRTEKCALPLCAGSVGRWVAGWVGLAICTGGVLRYLAQLEMLDSGDKLQVDQAGYLPPAHSPPHTASTSTPSASFQRTRAVACCCRSSNRRCIAQRTASRAVHPLPSLGPPHAPRDSPRIVRLRRCLK